MAKIEELTGIKRSETQIRVFLKKIDVKISLQSVCCLPAADVDEQERFKKEELEPILEEAKKEERAVYFVDAAHFVLAP